MKTLSKIACVILATKPRTLQALGGLNPYYALEIQKQQDLTRHLQDCPPELEAEICDPVNIQTIEGYQLCAGACLLGVCCQSSDNGCQGCEACLTYMACANLPLDPPGSSDNSTDDTCEVFSIDYYTGFNLHFLVDPSDASDLMPDSRFSPMELDCVDEKVSKVHVNQGDRKLEINSLRRRGRNLFAIPTKHGNYVSLYAAVIGVYFVGQYMKVGRADVWTYVIGPDGKHSMVMLFAYIEVPEFILNQNETVIEAYKTTVLDFSLDGRTGAPAYPHFFVSTFDVRDDGFTIAGGDLEGSIAISLGDDCEKSDSMFTRDFVLANSVAWRSCIDKNDNYFNQDFIDAFVCSYKMDHNCFLLQDIDLLIQNLPASAELHSIQKYGSDEDVITWHYEDSTVTENTPYLTLDQKQDAIALKQQVYSDMWMKRADAISNGAAESIFRLHQGANALFLIWELSEDEIDSFSDMLRLSDLGLTITPIPVVVGDDAKKILALNIYTAVIEGDPSGEAVRFEYSTFVKAQDRDQPYYIIIEAGSSNDSLDPVLGATNATNATIERQGDNIIIETDTLHATIDLGPKKLVHIEKTWIYANGRVYWRNGVYDNVFFDTSFTLQDATSGSVLELSGDSQWSPFLADDDPIYTFVYEDEIDYAITPWRGIDDMIARVQQNGAFDLLPSLYQLIEIKRYILNGMALLSYVNILTGAQDPLVDLVVHGSYPEFPRLMMNFEILPDAVPEFARLINLRDELSLAPMALAEGTDSAFILTLGVFSESLAYDYDYQQAPFWYKAVWSTYVHEDNGSLSINEFHVILSEVSLDLEDLFKQPAEEFSMSFDASELNVTVKEGNVEMQIHTPLVDTEERLSLNVDWVNSHNKVYWKKGVYDNLYFHDELLNAKLIPINIEMIEIVQSAPWVHLIGEKPFEAFYLDGNVTFVSSVWENLEVLV